MSFFYRGDSFRIARAASGQIGAAKRPVFVLQCYLDDSGTSGLPIVTMAGFVASFEQWERLEPGLDAILNEVQVPIFHSKEFHGTKPPFRNWNKPKKRTLIENLFSFSRGALYGVSATVKKAAVAEANKSMLAMSPLCVCFSTIMIQLLTDERIAPTIKESGISFVVESGSPQNAGIEQFFHRMARTPELGEYLRSISFVTKGSCRAIQLADILAFYSRRHMRNLARFPAGFALPYCPILQIIERHGPVWYRGGRGPMENAGSLAALGLNGLHTLTKGNVA